MAEITRLNGYRGGLIWILWSVSGHPSQRWRWVIQSHVTGLSVSNTVELLECLGVQRSRKAIHDWVRKAELQPEIGKSPNQVTVDETVIRINDQQFWLYAAADSQSNDLLHVRLFLTTTTAFTEIFLRELRQKHDVETAVFLVDGAQHLQTALQRAGLRFQMRRQGNRNAVERIFREPKQKNSLFSNCFSHVKSKTAETWLQSFARWHNAPS